jgi:hypothetical protein
MSLQKCLTGCMHPEAAARFPAAGSAEHTGAPAPQPGTRRGQEATKNSLE